MAREKIFKPEDFDKDPETPKKNNLGRIVGVVIGILIIVCLVVFFGMKSCNKDDPDSNAVLPQGVEATEVSDSTSEEMAGQENEDLLPTKMVIDSEKDRDATVPEAKAQDELSSVSTLPSPKISSSSPSASSDIDKEALKVIHGDYGNNPNRKNALGDSYQSIQAKVNEMKRKGVF